MAEVGEWIEWGGNGGGYAPPPDYNGGPIKYRCGEIDETLTNRFEENGNKWNSAEWRHDNEPFDIIAYRIVTL